MPRERGWAIACLLGAVALWSSSLSVVSIAVESATPGTVTFWRCVVGAAALAGWVLAKRRIARAAHEHAPSRAPAREHWRDALASWRWAIASGLTCGAAFLLIAIGMQDVGSGPAGIVLSAIPGLTILLARIEGHGPSLDARHVLSLAIGAAGALTLALPAGGGWSVAGLALLGLAALSHAATNVTAGRSLERLDPVVVAAVSLGVAAIACAPFANFGASIPVAGVIAIAILGVLPSGIAYVMYFHGIRVLGPAAAAYANFLVPPVAVLAGMVALGERPDAATFAALSLAMIALAIGLGGSSAPPREEPLLRARPLRPSPARRG